MTLTRILLAVSALGAAACASSPESRAVAFLAREVPAWKPKNRCFSCHNNGDAARALYTARLHGIPFDPRALEATTSWLLRPEGWKDNGPDVEFSDKKLAALQFSFALLTAMETGALPRGEALARAAGQVRDLQEADGSWKVDADGLPGSPVTYGRTLATVAATRVLAAAGTFPEPLRRAEAWLRAQMPVTMLDHAALLLTRDEETRLRSLDVLRKTQTRDGGWGPYATSPPETFDTALAVLGLSTLRDQAGVPEMIRRGRQFLLEAQLRDGSWPETTRPPGAESYAQRISTTGWATLALLATRK